MKRPYSLSSYFSSSLGNTNALIRLWGLSYRHKPDMEPVIRIYNEAPSLEEAD